MLPLHTDCDYSLNAMSENDNEKELLEMFVKTCRTVRDPRNRRSRAEMAIQASRWEIVFQKRLDELTPQRELTLPKMLAQKAEVAA